MIIDKCKIQFFEGSPVYGEKLGVPLATWTFNALFDLEPLLESAESFRVTQSEKLGLLISMRVNFEIHDC